MKLKRVLVVILSIFLLTGCNDMMNSPSKEVEEFLSKYQNMDEEILTQLDLMLDNNSNYNDKEKEDYKALMIKQYQNLSYKITDERVEDDTATIDIEVEVYDFKTAINNSTEYYNSHKDELKDTSLTEYQIKQMKDVTERVVYPITLNLTKNKDNKWKIDNLSDTDRQKLHGIY